MNILVMFIIGIYFKHFYDMTNFIKGIYYILYKLDCDLRTDVYLGVTGLLTAIVIFVAELASSTEKSKVDRNVFIKSTKILRNVIFMIINMLGLLISKTITGTAYYVFQIILNTCIIISIFQTLNMFKTLIGLTLSENELAIEKDKYIREKLKNYDKKIKNLKQTEELFEKEIEKKFEKNKLISYKKYAYGLEDYKAIEAKKEGILLEIDANKIENIVASIHEKRKEKIILNVELDENKTLEFKQIKDVEENLREENSEEMIVVITSLKGQYVYSKNPLFYIKKEYIEFQEDIFLCFKIIKDDKHINEDASIVIEETINKIRNTKYYNTIHASIVNFFEDILDNEWKYVEDLFYSKIYKLAEEVVRTCDYEKVYILYKAIEDIALILIKEYKINEFEKYYDILFLLLLNIFDKPNIELENLSFEFINFVNSCIYRCEKAENKIDFLDLLLSKVLSLIKKLLRRKNIDAICVILNNLSVSSEYRIIKSDSKELDVLFQFVIGIIYAMMYEEKVLKESNYKGIKTIIDKMVSQFKFDYKYNVSELIMKFKEISRKVTKIFGVYDNFAFGEQEDHKNMLSWSGNSLNINYVLIALLNLYQVIGRENLQENKINKQDQYFCDDVLRIINDNRYKELFNNFQDYSGNNNEIIVEVLEEIKKKSIEKEYLYEIQTELNSTSINIFKNIIFEGINKGDTIIELFPSNKIEYSKNISKKSINIRDYIRREMFFGESDWSQYYAKEVVEAINSAKSDRIIKYLEENSQKVSNLEEALKKLDNLKNLVILSGDEDSWAVFGDKDFYEYKDTKIPVKKDFVDKTIILDKNSLPILKYMSFDKENKLKGEMKGSTYIVLLDCANDEELVNKIVEESVQDGSNDIESIKKYVMPKCVFQVFHSVEIKEYANKEIYIISNEDFN